MGSFQWALISLFLLNLKYSELKPVPQNMGSAHWHLTLNPKILAHRGGRTEAAPASRGRGRGRGRAVVMKKRRWNSDEDFSSGATSEEEEDRPEYEGEPVRP